MFFQHLRQWLGLPTTSTPNRPARPRVRLAVEPLEDRAVPASFTAATVPDLIGAITAANQSAEADTITLAPGKTFTLKQVNNTWDYSSNGLPVVAAAGGPLTIVGNGDIIERSTAGKTPKFRLLAVAPGASLTLENLTMQGGSDGYFYGAGGAIYNAGTLSLKGVTVQNNSAASGGGIYSNGSLLLQNCLIQSNQAVGRDGSNGFYVGPNTPKDHEDFRYVYPTPGQDAFGGGVCVAGGTASLLGTTVINNTAKGGKGGQGKGDPFVAPDGIAQGGGVYISSWASVSLDAFTVAHVMNNTADDGPNIYGPFTIS